MSTPIPVLDHPRSKPATIRGAPDTMKWAKHVSDDTDTVDDDWEQEEQGQGGPTLGFHHKVLENEGIKLKYYTEISNEKERENDKMTKFLNLSVGHVLKKISSTFISILTELFSKKSQDVQNVQKSQGRISAMVSPFIRDDRLIYVGLTMIMLAFAIYVVDLTA